MLNKVLETAPAKTQKIFSYNNLKMGTNVKQISTAPAEETPEWMYDEARFQAILYEAANKLGWDEEDIEYYITLFEQMECETAFKFHQTSSE